MESALQRSGRASETTQCVQRHAPSGVSATTALAENAVSRRSNIREPENPSVDLHPEPNLTTRSSPSGIAPAAAQPIDGRAREMLRVRLLLRALVRITAAPIGN